MKAVSAPEAKHHFGQLIDEARAEPVVVEMHGRPVVVVLAVEEYQRLTGRTVEPSGKKREDERYRMPILNRLTRDEDIRTAQHVPYRLLEEVPDLSAGDGGAGT